MDYLRIYNSLTADARNNPKPEQYKETHHIIPKCMGGSNRADNLVKLTARQHFIAHWLLYKIHRTVQMAHAWANMCRIGRGQDQRRVNSKHFARAKHIRAAHLSENSLGAKNHFYGKKHTAESKQKIADAQYKLQLWKHRSETHKENLLSSQQKPKSEEHKKKIGRKGFKMLQNITTHTIIRVSNDDPRCDSPDWVNPRKMTPEPRRQCLYCDIVSNNANLKRWHDNNCKRKP